MHCTHTKYFNIFKANKSSITISNYFVENFLTELNSSCEISFLRFRCTERFNLKQIQKKQETSRAHMTDDISHRIVCASASAGKHNQLRSHQSVTVALDMQGWPYELFMFLSFFPFRSPSSIRCVLNKRTHSMARIVIIIN